MMLDFQGKAEGYGCPVAARKLVTPTFEALPSHLFRTNQKSLLPRRMQESSTQCDVALGDRKDT